MSKLYSLNNTQAWERLRNVQPDLYAKTRNHLNGDVSRLSPFVTHGLLGTPDLYAWGCEQTGRTLHPAQDKWVMELGWREFFQHVLKHQSWSVLKPLRAPANGVWLGDLDMPHDVLTAQTGIPAIDMAVKELIQTGYLHNHARMWLASYLIHIRKVSWLKGANWMLGWLFDGDVASNHLSWQWVASTFSSKPYLFNADNVAKYAPTAWHSSNTILDCSYEDMAIQAASTFEVPMQSAHSAGISTQINSPLALPANELYSRPPKALIDRYAIERIDKPQLIETALLSHDAWVHPWCLNASNSQSRPNVGLLSAQYHQQWPWSYQRWELVLAAMAESSKIWLWIEPEVWFSTDFLNKIYSTRSNRRAQCMRTYQPGYRDMLEAFEHAKLVQLEEVPNLWESPPHCCSSFSQWIRKSKFIGASIHTGNSHVRWHA
jgi:deoxyribodipyrimidine photo-lyase